MDLRLEWETALPRTGFLPQLTHFLAMIDI
jgi:hypothetical protein